METKRTDFDNIRQDVNTVKKYATDLQTLIGVNKMTSVVYGEVKKQKGAFNYDLFELKLDFSSEFESFAKDVSKFDSRGKQAGCYTTTHKKDDCQFSN